MGYARRAHKMHEVSGQPIQLCVAYARAGLTVNQVSDQEKVDRIGLTRAEDAALEDHYRTPLEPMGDCSTGCPLCHPKLPRDQWDR